MQRVLKVSTKIVQAVACCTLVATVLGGLRLGREPSGASTRANAAPRTARAVSMDAAGWREVSRGVRLRTFYARDGLISSRITALRFAPNRLRVATGAMLDASQWRARARAIAATNGGFFDAADKPMGLRASGNKRLTKLRRADWGVFAVTTRGARVVHTRDYEAFRTRERVLEAVQCGPRLVVNGRVTQLKPQHARRTGLGVARDGSVILAVSSDSMSFPAWAALWASKSGLNCRDALNLDGGGSTQMALRTPRENFFIPGNRAVPDAIIVR